MAQKFYVYLLIDPRTGAVFYVGKGTGKRAKVHFSASSLKRRNMKNSTIKAIISENLSPVVEIVSTDLSEPEAFDVEKTLIAKYGRRDIGTGILTNLTDGGEGTSGYRHAPRSEETRRKISEAHKGMRYSEEVNRKKGSPGERNPMYGKKKSENFRRVMKEIHEARKASGAVNFNAKRIRIFDATGKMVHECHGDFSKICTERGFPFNALTESYKRNGRPIFTVKRNKKYLEFIGWYATIVTEQCPNQSLS
jgi:hypothetical protein